MIEEKVFTEKYRPQTLDEVYGQDEVVNRMKKWVSDDSMPNLLLSGPAGSGKTASAVAFARDKYGGDWESNFIALNASDERGIDTVRERIKGIAEQRPSGDYQHKIIFLDEVDHMTKDGQAALRRIMEKYSDVTRFFLSCNYISKLIDPIQSRCQVLPFNKLDDSDIETILMKIIDAEGVEYEESAVDKIIDYVDGDARRAVQTLQSSVNGGELTEELLDLVGSQIDREVLDAMIDDALDGNMESLHNTLVNDVVPNTVDYSRLLSEFMKSVRVSDEIHDDVRWYIFSQIGETEQALQEGNSAEIQLMSLFSKILVAQNSSIPNYQEK